jgi:hypothetical protein
MSSFKIHILCTEDNKTMENEMAGQTRDIRNAYKIFSVKFWIKQTIRFTQ